MYEIRHEIYRNFWKIVQVRYASGRIWWHFYRIPPGQNIGTSKWRYIDKKRTVSKSKGTIDSILAWENRDRDLTTAQHCSTI